MAAPSYATDLTVINACDNNASPTAWTNIGTGADATETDYFIHNGACISKPFNITAGGLYTDYGSNLTFAAGEVYWLWAWFGAPNAMLAEASGGYRALVGSSAGNYEMWNVMGSDTNPYGGWRCIPVDIVNVTRDAVTGSPAGTYRIFGCYVNTSTGIGKGNPLGIDVIRKGRGELRIADGDLGNGYATFAGAAAANDASTARWGLCQAQDGTYLIQGLLILGYAAAVDFRDQNKVIIIANTKKVQSTFNRIEVRNASSRVDWTNINLTALGTVSRGQYEMIDAADVNLDTCVFTDMDTFIFLSSATVLDSTFRRCNAVTGGGGSFLGCVFAASTVAADASAFVWNHASDLDGKLDGATFSKGTNAHHAITLGTSAPTTHTLRNITFTGFNASDGQNDSVLLLADRGVDTAWTINASGCSGTVSYKKVRAGDTVTVNVDQVTLTIEVRDNSGALITDLTEITLVRTSDTTVLHHAEDVTTGITSYTYGYSGDVECYVNVLSVENYVPRTVEPVVLGDSDQTVVVQLESERGRYLNVVGVYATAILADGPIAYWRLGEIGATANDEVGTANGSYVNTPTTGAAGLLEGDADRAVTFARASSEMVAIDSNMPAGSSSGATFELWLSVPSVLDEEQHGLVTWGNQGTGLGFHWLYLYESGSSIGLAFQYRDATTFRQAYSASWTPPTDTPIHLVVVHDYSAETVKYFIDGVQYGATVDVSAFGAPLTVPASSVVRIAAYSAGTHHFNGTLDEVAIYDSVLSPAQIADHYAAGT